MISTLEGIRLKMASWAQINRFESFAMQKEIQEDIQRCHNQISDCLGKFQVAYVRFVLVLSDADVVST
jgi:hypothetical protein